MKTLTQIDKDIKATQRLRTEKADTISLPNRLKINGIGSARRKQCDKNTLYNVCWYIGGICKEILAYNKTKPVALGIKWSKETSTHKSGKIILEPQR